MGPLTKEIPEIDFRSIWDILRLRWWIFPLCVVVCVGLLFTQESDLQSTPTSVLVIATYGPRNEMAGLSLYGIDPTAVREVFKTSSKVFVSKLQKLSKNNLASQLMCQFLDRSNKFH